MKSDLTPSPWKFPSRPQGRPESTPITCPSYQPFSPSHPLIWFRVSVNSILTAPSCLGLCARSCWVLPSRTACQLKSSLTRTLSSGSPLLPALWLWPVSLQPDSGSGIALQAPRCRERENSPPQPVCALEGRQKDGFRWEACETTSLTLLPTCPAPSHPIPSNSVRRVESAQNWGPGETPVWVGSSPRSGAA